MLARRQAGITWWQLAAQSKTHAKCSAVTIRFGWLPMTNHRLLNNVSEFHEVFIDFKSMRKQLHGAKVWFPQKYESLLAQIKGDWTPVNSALAPISISTQI